MEASIESARPPARPQATVAAWAQSVEQAIASQQWHGAWRALIDAALPAETAVQQSLLTALDAWDGLAADSGAEPRHALVQQVFDALHVALVACILQRLEGVICRASRMRVSRKQASK